MTTHEQILKMMTKREFTLLILWKLVELNERMEKISEKEKKDYE